MVVRSFFLLFAMGIAAVTLIARGDDHYEGRVLRQVDPRTPPSGGLPRCDVR